MVWSHAGWGGRGAQAGGRWCTCGSLRPRSEPFTGVFAGEDGRPRKNARPRIFDAFATSTGLRPVHHSQGGSTAGCRRCIRSPCPTPRANSGDFGEAVVIGGVERKARCFEGDPQDGLRKAYPAETTGGTAMSRRLPAPAPEQPATIPSLAVARIPGDGRQVPVPSRAGPSSVRRPVRPPARAIWA